MIFFARRSRRAYRADFGAPISARSEQSFPRLGEQDVRRSLALRLGRVDDQEPGGLQLLQPRHDLAGTQGTSSDVAGDAFEVLVGVAVEPPEQDLGSLGQLQGPESVRD